MQHYQLIKIGEIVRMPNLVSGLARLFTGGGNNGNSGGGGALVQQANTGQITPGTMMVPYDELATAPNGRPLPEYKVPKIDAPEIATEEQAFQAEQAAEIMKEGVKNGSRVLKSAGKIEGYAADLMDAYEDYLEKRIDAEEQKQNSNVKLGKRLLKSASKHQDLAVSLIAERNRQEANINGAINTYERTSGWKI